MPIVNGKHYPYTAAGKKAAKKVAKGGKKMMMDVGAYHRSRGSRRPPYGERVGKLSVKLGKSMY